MPKQYLCDLCKKVFNQKSDFTKHQNKKTPCISLSEMQQITQTNEVKMNNKTTLTSVFKYCLDVLRNNEHLTGDKALRTLAHLLDLRLLEPKFDNEIDIDTYEYDFSSYEDEIIEKQKEKLLSIVRFSNLAKEEEENIPKIMKCLWDEILSVHPITKNIFLKGKGFDIQHQSTYKKLIDKLYSFDFEAVDEDILGEVYEEVIKDVMTGKVLGQFFTPSKVKQMMIKLIDPQLKSDGTIEKIFDPAMGTGGFLISSLRHLLQQSKTKGIKMNWDFISNEGLGGREAEPDTYQLAISNMLISSGHMFNVLEKGDSIRNPITNKYDIILANPPFGIKGLKYDDFQSPLKSEYVPIKSDNAVSLFIQAIIYMLKINGKCAVVLPDGQDLFSKTNTTLVAIREYLMKTCDLKEIIYLKSGIFAHTSIKTCIFYFVKKREGTDVLETKIKVSKTQKETGRDYKFSKTHQTTEVKFYDYNHNEDIKKPLIEVPIEKIANNSYSLNYAEYMKDEAEAIEYEEGVVVKTLDQIFHITKGTLQSSKNIEGEYAFITASDTNKTHNSFTHDCECVMLVGGAEGSLAKAQYFKGKFIASDLLYVLISKKQNEINYKYIWYYLNFNREKHLADNTICRGTPKKMISKDRCSNIKIPIPSLERQQEIVKYLDFIYEKANKTSNQKIAELKQLNEYCLNNQKMFGENVMKTLREVCEVNQGNSLTKTEMLDGIYDVIGGGKIIGKHNQKNRDGNDFTLTRVGDININYIDKPYYLTDNGFSLKSKQEDIMTKYIYYLLLHNKDYLTNLYQGTAQKVISKTNLKSIKIHIPSLECQKEIVEYCEYNDTLIKQLEKEIENNKKQAQQFITGIVKSQVQTEEQSDTS